MAEWEVICPVRIRLLAGHIYAATKMGMWGFGSKGNLVFTTSMYQKELLNLLELSGCMDYLKTLEGGCRTPVLVGDEIGMVWVAEHYYREDKPACLILFGPVFLSQVSVKNIEESLKKKIFPLSARIQMFRIIASFPVMPFSLVRQYAMMLHHCITEELYLDFSSYGKELLHFQNDALKAACEGRRELEHDSNFDPEHTMALEQHLLQYVKDGNGHNEELMNSMTEFSNLLVSHTGNPVRDAKNTVIIFTSQCCRAAIEGGLPIRKAKEIEGEYIRLAEQCTTVTSLMKLDRQMLEEFITQVRKANESPLISQAIRESCDYMRANITKSFSLADVAKHVGYTEYYFTRKFSKEMGIRVNDYVKEAKVEYAKIQLLTTSKGIQEISDALNFGNRTYFSRVFREITGVTPAVFRNQMGKEKEDETSEETETED